jgi:hypothetical protein
MTIEFPGQTDKGFEMDSVEQNKHKITQQVYEVLERQKARKAESLLVSQNFEALIKPNRGGLFEKDILPLAGHYLALLKENHENLLSTSQQQFKLFQDLATHLQNCMPNGQIEARFFSFPHSLCTEEWQEYEELKNISRNWGLWEQGILKSSTKSDSSQRDVWASQNSLAPKKLLDATVLGITCAINQLSIEAIANMIHGYSYGI